MTIAKIIASRDPADIVTCDVSTPFGEAIGILARKRIGALPVMRGSTVAGIVSERDVVYCMGERGRDCLDLPVEAVMTAPAISVTPSTPIDEALAMMTKRRFRHFPVLDSQRLVAFISIGDLVKHKIDEVEHEAKAMRDYIQTA